MWIGRRRQSVNYAGKIDGWKTHLADFQLRGPRLKGAPNEVTLRSVVDEIINEAQRRLQDAMAEHLDKVLETAKKMTAECDNRIGPITTPDDTDYAALLANPAVQALIKAQATLIAKKAEEDDDSQDLIGEQ